MQIRQKTVVKKSWPYIDAGPGGRGKRRAVSRIKHRISKSIRAKENLEAKLTSQDGLAMLEEERQERQEIAQPDFLDVLEESLCSEAAEQLAEMYREISREISRETARKVRVLA